MNLQGLAISPVQCESSQFCQKPSLPETNLNQGEHRGGCSGKWDVQCDRARENLYSRFTVENGIRSAMFPRTRPKHIVGGVSKHQKGEYIEEIN